MNASTSHSLPTAAKLVGAVMFFGVGWVAGMAVVDTLPEGQSARFFPLVIGLIGLTQGWMVSGREAGQGIAVALANGLRTSVQIAVLGLTVFALREMFGRAANLRYDGAGEAVTATLQLWVDYFLQMGTVTIWGILIIGGMAAGLLVEAASRRWR
jgi:hypothetical protein